MILEILATLFGDTETDAKAAIWLSCGTFIVTILGAVVAALVTLSRRRGESKKEESTLSREERDDAVKHWKDIAKARETQHKQDIQNLALQLQSHRQELTELRMSERECQLRAARLEERLDNQQQQLEAILNQNIEFKEMLTRHGLRDLSDVHRALPPDQHDGG